MPQTSHPFIRRSAGYFYSDVPEAPPKHVKYLAAFSPLPSAPVTVLVLASTLNSWLFPLPYSSTKLITSYSFLLSIPLLTSHVAFYLHHYLEDNLIVLILVPLNFPRTENC